MLDGCLPPSEECGIGPWNCQSTREGQLVRHLRPPSMPGYWSERDPEGRSSRTSKTQGRIVRLFIAGPGRARAETLMRRRVSGSPSIGLRRPGPGRGRKLFVSQFPRDYREEDLGDLMRPYGTVEESVVLRDRPGPLPVVAGGSGLRGSVGCLGDGTARFPTCQPTSDVQQGDLGKAPLQRSPPHSGWKGPPAETQEGRGAGFVIFSGASACERAIQALDGQLVLPNMRRPLQVQPEGGAIERERGGGIRGGGGRGLVLTVRRDSLFSPQTF